MCPLCLSGQASIRRNFNVIVSAVSVSIQALKSLVGQAQIRQNLNLVVSAVSVSNKVLKSVMPGTLKNMAPSCYTPWLCRTRCLLLQCRTYATGYVIAPPSELSAQICSPRLKQEVLYGG